MPTLALHSFHHGLNARFAEVNGAEVVLDYGDASAEHAALHANAGVLDLSFRSRLCLTGADRVRFLHGQVTNDVNRLNAGEGCYAALVTAKGKIQSDLNIHRLADELLLDFEPGLASMVAQRFEKFVVADNVQVIDVAAHYGLLSVQGREAEAVVRATGIFESIPAKPFAHVRVADPVLGEIYLVNQPRLTMPAMGFDLFVPATSLTAVMERLVTSAKAMGGRPCGWQALENARIEAGVPRFGADMDETNLPLECGIERRAISYTKGCYIGQEVINRVHTIGHVNKELRRLRLADELPALPVKGDKLFHAGAEAGYVTSAVKSPLLKANVALGYVRREANATGTELTLRTANGETPVTIEGSPV